MRDKVLNMNDLTINIIQCEMKVKCFENPHYAYTHRYVAFEENKEW